MKKLVFLLLSFISFDLKAQATYNVSIVLDQDTLEQGQSGFATYLVSGSSSNLTFIWEYLNENNSVFYNSILTSNNDTLHFAYSFIGLHEIKLYVFDNLQIVDTIVEMVFIKGVLSLPCLNSPPACELVCNGNLESTAPNNPATTNPDLVWGLNQLYEAVGFDSFSPQIFPSCNINCSPNSQFLIYNSPDYFSLNNMWGFSSNFTSGNPCFTGQNPINVPNNFAGSQTSHLSGNSYAGFIGYIDDPVNYYLNSSTSGGIMTREYVQGSLFSPMAANQTYFVSFWVSLSENSNFAIEDIGIKFLNHSGTGFPDAGSSIFKYKTTNLVTEPCINCPFPELTQEIVDDFNNPVIPDVENINGVITDKTNWVLISGTYTSSASGGENFFLIGTFSSDANTNSQPVSGGLQCQQSQAYYYVDDISVSTVPTSISIAATPNPVCSGQSVTLNVSPIVPNATYTWYDSQSNVIGSGASIIVNPLITSTYSVTLITVCNNPTASITVNVSNPTANAGPDQTICPFTSTTLNVVNPDPNLIYHWYLGPTFLAAGTSINVTPLGIANTYTLIAIDPISNCQATDNVTVNFFTTIPILFSAPPSSCCTNPTISVNPDYVNYTWTITPAILFSGQGTNSISTIFDPNTSYEICLSAVDANGCIVESCVEIESCCTPVDPIPTTLAQEFGVCSNGPLLISQIGVNFNNNYFVFYQDLIIDQTTTFDNCNIRMAPGTKIIVNPTKTLLISESVIKALCPEMWQGITVADPTATVRFTKESEIWDAIDAVYSQNGGIYQITDRTKMVNNHRSLVVINYSGTTHPGVIEQSEVYTTAANLYPPHSGERMYQGVFISEAGDVTIGRKVRFDNMDYGVYSTGSNVNVYGNIFENINRPSTVIPCPLCFGPVGTAIYATTKVPLVNKMLRVGSIVPGTDNTIRFCYIGVETTRNMNLRVIENKFGFNEEAAVMAHTGNQRTILIRDNKINFSKMGVHLVNMPLSTVNIDKNEIKNTILGCPSPCVDNAGIMIENTSPSTMSIEITDNTIERKKTGIWLRLVNGPNVNIHKLSNPTGNDISFPQLNTNATGTNKFYGIRLEKCDNVTVDENLISKAGLDPTLNVFKNILGISTESSTNCVITENVTTKMGVGLWINGACQGTIYGCNVLHKAWNSVFFDNGSITDQLTGNVAQANRYLNNLDAASKISGNQSASGIDWFHNISGVNSGPNFNPNPSIVNGLLINSSGNGTTDVCALYFGPPGGGSREALLPIVQNQRSFSSSQAENEFWDKDFGYNSLHQNYSWMNTGNPDDTIYQNYYNDLNPSCINKYCGVKQAIENEDYLLADAKNNQIQGNCQIEAHRKSSTQILLKFIQGDTLTNADSVYLDEMAYSDPFIYGEAVMTARVILQLDPSVNDLRTVQMGEEVSDTIAEIVVKLYPNPTKDYVTLEITDDSGISDYYFEIIDISGRIIFSNFTDKNKTILDLASYENGIYFINVTIRGDLIERKKLIISGK